MRGWGLNEDLKGVSQATSQEEETAMQRPMKGA